MEKKIVFVRKKCGVKQNLVKRKLTLSYTYTYHNIDGITFYNDTKTFYNDIEVDDDIDVDEDNGCSFFST